MDHIFLLNPSVTSSDIQEAIHKRLTQLRSITNSLLLGNEEITNSASYGAVWAIDSLLDELRVLCEKTS
jgi:hypothetical protein